MERRLIHAAHPMLQLPTHWVCGQKRTGSMANILFLGADPTTVCQYRNHFERAGIAVASVEMVESLETSIQVARPSAILLDLSRTTGEGERLIQAIRSQPELKALPVFALRAATGPEEAKALDSVEGVTRSFSNDPAAVLETVQAIASALGVEIPPGAPSGASSDAGRQNGSVVEDPSSLIPQLKEAFRLFCSAENGTRLELLTRMQEQVRNLRRSFLAADARALTAFSSALAKLFMTLSKDLARVNPSSLRTLSTALDVLAMSANGRRKDVESGPVRVLIVDGEPLSRHALQFALGSPDLELSDCESLDRALQFLQRMEYDVVFADFKMVRSCDFSAQIRKLPNGAGLPIVIVTSSSPDFEVRVQSALSGGCDLIAKPFTPSEMVVKAFTSAFQRRLGRSPVCQAATVQPAAASAAFPSVRRNGPPPVVPIQMAPSHSSPVFNTAGSASENGRRQSAAITLEREPCENPMAVLDDGPPDEPQDKPVSSQTSQAPFTRTREVPASTPTIGWHPPANEPPIPPPSLPPKRQDNGATASEPAALQPFTLPQPPPPAADDPLRGKFEEWAACRALNDELSRVRSLVQAERSRRQEIEHAMADLQSTHDDLAAKLESARQREAAQKDRVHTLESSLEEAMAKLTSAEAALQAQGREVRRLQLRSKDLEEQLGDLTSQVSTQLAVEESRRRREAELEACVLNQQAEITKARATLAADQAQVQRARERMQSALNLMLQELNGGE